VVTFARFIETAAPADPSPKVSEPAMSRDVVAFPLFNVICAGGVAMLVVKIIPVLTTESEFSEIF
jgi:hypothetical protein